VLAGGREALVTARIEAGPEHTLPCRDVENLHSFCQGRALDRRAAEMREVAGLDLVVVIGRSS